MEIRPLLWDDLFSGINDGLQELLPFSSTEARLKETFTSFKALL